METGEEMFCSAGYNLPLKYASIENVIIMEFLKSNSLVGVCITGFFNITFDVTSPGTLSF